MLSGSWYVRSKQAFIPPLYCICLHSSADTILEYVLPYLMAIAGASPAAMGKVRGFGTHTDADVWTNLWHLFNRTHRDRQLATAVNPGGWLTILQGLVA